MKKIIVIMMLLINITTQVCANQVFALKHNSDRRTFQNTLLELNPTSGEVINEVKLAESYRIGIEKLTLPSHHKMVFYASLEKKKATLQIVDKNDISQIQTLQVDQLNSHLLPNHHQYRFYHLTADHNHLLLHTGHKKNQQLMVVDLNSGEVIRQIPLSKFKNKLSLSSDGHYLLANNTSRDELVVIRMSDYSVAMTSVLGDYRDYGIIHNDHLYLTKYKGKDPRKEYWFQTLDLKSGQKTDADIKSTHSPVFAINPADGQLYSLMMTDRNRKALWTSITGTVVNVLAELELKIEPKLMTIDSSLQKAFVRGTKRVATIDLTDLTQHTITKLPFDTTHHFYNDTGDLLYLKEGSGSEVAVVDVKSGELIERSGTGRAGVKFGQFMASVALAGVGANFGYVVFLGIYSDTGFTLNHDQDKLYVINAKTNDVTQFNAADLSDRRAIATGRGTFFVYPGQKTDAPVWVFSSQRINQINDKVFELEQEIEYERLIGFDAEENKFVIKTKSAVETYDMNTGQIINQWPLSEVDGIWSEN